MPWLSAVDRTPKPLVFSKYSFKSTLCSLSRVPIDGAIDNEDRYDYTDDMQVIDIRARIYSPASRSSNHRVSAMGPIGWATGQRGSHAPELPPAISGRRSCRATRIPPCEFGLY